MRPKAKYTAMFEREALTKEDSSGLRRVYEPFL